MFIALRFITEQVRKELDAQPAQKVDSTQIVKAGFISSGMKIGECFKLELPMSQMIALDGINELAGLFWNYVVLWMD